MNQPCQTVTIHHSGAHLDPTATPLGVIYVTPDSTGYETRTPGWDHYLSQLARSAGHVSRQTAAEFVKHLVEDDGNEAEVGAPPDWAGAEASEPLQTPSFPGAHQHVVIRNPAITRPVGVVTLTPNGTYATTWAAGWETYLHAVAQNTERLGRQRSASDVATIVEKDGYTTTIEQPVAWRGLTPPHQMPKDATRLHIATAAIVVLASTVLLALVLAHANDSPSALDNPAGLALLVVAPAFLDVAAIHLIATRRVRDFRVITTGVFVLWAAIYIAAGAWTDPSNTVVLPLVLILGAVTALSWTPARPRPVTKTSKDNK